MFDIGISEIGVIAVVALIVIGPERLPRVARTVGTLLGRAQRYVNDVKAEVNREIELEELRKLQKEMQDAAHGIREQVTTAGAEVQSAVQDAGRELQQGVSTVEAAITAEPVGATPSIAGPAGIVEGTGSEPAGSGGVDTASLQSASAEPSPAGPAGAVVSPLEPAFEYSELQEPPMEPTDPAADASTKNDDPSSRDSPAQSSLFPDDRAR